jgi:hypothetical protein
LRELDLSVGEINLDVSLLSSMSNIDSSALDLILKALSEDHG